MAPGYIHVFFGVEWKVLSCSVFVKSLLDYHDFDLASHNHRTIEWLGLGEIFKYHLVQRDFP